MAREPQDETDQMPDRAEDALPVIPPLAPMPSDTKAGFVALIGVPNAGKSTLLNSLVGTKVSIVSRKVQTTRALVRGIVMEDKAQIILVDTPGIFAPKRRLDRAMVHSAWSGRPTPMRSVSSSTRARASTTRSRRSCSACRR